MIAHKTALINKDDDRDRRHAANRKTLVDAVKGGFTHCLKGRCKRMERTMRKLGFHCQSFVHGRLMVRNISWYIS